MGLRLYRMTCADDRFSIACANFDRPGLGWNIVEAVPLGRHGGDCRWTDLGHYRALRRVCRLELSFSNERLRTEGAGSPPLLSDYFDVCLHRCGDTAIAEQVIDF